MSFIKDTTISSNEARVLKFALTKIIPQLETVVQDARGDRKEKANDNLVAAKEMLKDVQEIIG